MTSEFPTQLNIALSAGQSYFQSVWWKDSAGNTIPLTGLEVTWTVRIDDKIIRKDRSTLTVDDGAGRVELALSSGEVDYLAGTETFWGVTKLVIQDPLGPFYRVATGYVFRPGSFGEDFLLMGTSTDVQVFTSDGTWTKPAGAVAVFVRCIGGGAGGGSGRRGAAGTVRCGGGGGAGGLIAQRWFNPADLGATESITVGLGGTGGTGQTVNDTNGNSGSAGGASIFGNPQKIGCIGSNPGAGGSNATGQGGAAYTGTALAAGSGASASTTGGVGGSMVATQAGAAGGAGGGGVTSGDVANNGGAASISREGTNAGTYAGGIVGGAGPVSGTDNTIPGGGGGGGSAGAASITGVAQTGNNGRLWGGGGGGGGASLNGNNSGAGGNGANGIVVVYTIVQV